LCRAVLAILLLIPFFWEVRVILLLLVVGIASVGSHMPGRYRNYSLLHRRLIGSGDALRATQLLLGDKSPARRVD